MCFSQETVLEGTLCISEERTEREKADGAAGYVAMNEMFWRLNIHDWSNRDYFGCNFEKQEVSIDNKIRIGFRIRSEKKKKK
ncbi:hypothetical protein CRYUN_Cryun33cG0099300 [Craigia yunnanensis]